MNLIEKVIGNEVLGYKIFDLQLGDYKKDFEVFESEELAAEVYASCLWDQALEGNGGFEGTDEEIEKELKKYTDLQLLNLFDYSVEPVEAEDITQEDCYQLINEWVDSREKFIELLISTYNRVLADQMRLAIEEYAENNQKWWTENE